jgi:AcrR family transcriptional regulator
MSSTKATLSRQPQRQRGRDRVAALQAAAASLFLERGYDATTMTEIAARAGAAIGSLYLFFPTKAALAQAMATDLADALSARLDQLRDELAGHPPAAIADALFDVLSRFLADHPVYATLVELPGDEGWKRAVRARRRAQIEALFARSEPVLPPGQAERLAVIVPHLMAIPLRTAGLTKSRRDAVLNELRQMLRAHLAHEV